jgi:drug/metabolite transporter (DMT)-like permease
LWTKDVLKFSLLTNNIFRTIMQVGQLSLSAQFGSYFDVSGYRHALIGAQVAVTAGLGFYLFARPDDPVPFLWIGLGWACWLFYAVHNVALPNLALKFAPPEERAGYIAAYEALGSLLHAAATIGGGVLFDWIQTSPSMSLANACLAMLALGVVARALAIPLAALIREPTGVREESRD